MDNKQYLLDQIRKCKRKMNLAKLIDFGILYAAAGGIFGMLCEVVSLFIPFYYADLTAALCFGTGLLAGICYAVYRRADMKRAAGRLDSFGLKERMLTAYENIDKENEFAELQRQDALFHYNQIREQIRIPLFPDKRHVLALLVAVSAVLGMSLIPSPVREQAELSHQVQEQAEKEKEELKELLKALESVDMESLTEEQRAKLQEMLDTMKLSQEELAGADSWESLSAATQKLDYKYGQAAQSLEQLASQMENPDAAGVASAEALAKAASNQNGQQTASAGTPTGSSGEGDGEGKNGNSSGENDGQGGENGSGEEDGQNGENGSGEGGQGNSEGTGTGSGSGDGQGAGNGQGGGNGSGDGNSQGGNGSGIGTGGGRGTGSSDAAHDYVSIPNAVSDDPSLTGNKNGDQDSDYYRGQNGLAWEGEHVDYNSVIGEYTDSAYEGLANGRYPSGMESVIRDYFENLNK
ncbi:MAG: hypothetical protein HDQ96_07795 [Lachnospiraceae bacterium]|nr:hypothetical protein [Lachnospiraceae bacterium]